MAGYGDQQQFGGYEANQYGGGYEQPSYNQPSGGYYESTVQQPQAGQSQFVYAGTRQGTQQVPQSAYGPIDNFVPYADQGPPTVVQPQQQQMQGGQMERGLPPQTQFIDRPPQTIGSVTRDINGPQGTVMTSTWILPQEAPQWVSKSSTDWKSARTCYICALFCAFLAFLLGTIFSTVLVWQNPGRINRGTDLLELSVFFEEARYWDEVAVHNVRMCALTGDKAFGDKYRAAQEPLNAALQAYADKRPSIAENALFTQVLYAKTQMSTVETDAVAKCTALTTFAGSAAGTTTFNLQENDSTGVTNLLGTRYSTNHGAILKGFGYVNRDVQAAADFRRGDSWWARYNLSICFAVTVTICGLLFSFLAAAEANLARAMYLWDEGAPRMLPRQCQGAGAGWNDGERKSAITCAKNHPGMVFFTFLLFSFFAVTPFYMEYNAQETHLIHDDMTKMVRFAYEARYLDEALTHTSRLCALTGNRQWKDRYHELAPEMDYVLAGMLDQQEHLQDRIGFTDDETWGLNKDRIAAMSTAHAELTARRDNLMTVCADEVVVAQADGIGGTNRGIAFTTEYKKFQNDFQQNVQELANQILASLEWQVDDDKTKVNDGFRGTSLAFCIAMLIIAIVFVWFMLVLTRNQYESKVPASFKEVGLSGGW